MRRNIIIIIFYLSIIYQFFQSYSLSQQESIKKREAYRNYSELPTPPTHKSEYSVRKNSFSTFNRLPGLKPDHNYLSSIPIQFTNGNVMIAHQYLDSIFISTSTDGGLNFDLPKRFQKVGYDDLAFTGLRTNTNRVILIWSGLNKVLYPYISYSDDNGNSWSAPKIVMGGITASYCSNPDLIQSLDGTLWLFYKRFSNLYYRTSTNNGDNWSVEKTFISSPLNKVGATAVSANISKFIVVYSDSSSGNYDIYLTTTTDNGITWASSVSIVNSSFDEKPTRFLRQDDGTLCLIYQVTKPTRHDRIFQNDIHYIKSTDEGSTWSVPESFTQYIGDDLNPNSNLVDGKPFVSFSSKRFSVDNNYPLHIWYGKINVTFDVNPPPVVVKSSTTVFDFDIPVWIKVYVDDENAVTSVNLKYNQIIEPMFDDGLHNDELAGDYIFGVSIGPFSVIEDSTKQLIAVNNIKLPINNSGIIADVIMSEAFNYYFSVTDADLNSIDIYGGPLGYYSRGMFDNKVFLYSGGFFLSGLTNGQLWANAQATASRISDYLPGKVGSAVNDTKNKLYILRSSDPPFSSTWQSWIDAVSLGANFYDGDNDGLYNPVDKNSNGQWDPNEDRPDLIGDMTVWCVYNDRVPSSQRRFTDVSPQGIEIKQTVFAYGSKDPVKSNVIYIRYSILNAGTIASILDSVFFTIWTDGDLGDYTDDLVGCDTLLNSAYFYNEGYDNDYGSNAPAFFTQLLQSPPQFIPGLTFTDVNSNGIFDEGIDIPLDSAKNHRGIHLGIQNIPGARNIGATSFVHYMNSHFIQGDPSTKTEARNYMLGLGKSGNPINVCTWGYGTVLGGVNCAHVNPIFMYSGDPVTNYGWINNLSDDQRAMLNVGPFRLSQGKPVDIIVAYIVGRGTSPTNSISVTRTIASYSQSVYAGNFSLPTSVGDKETIVKDFQLYQNYPNPFNPTTVIRWQLPVQSHVTLKIYDILGREVTTLVDEVKEAGVHHSTFRIYGESRRTIPHSELSSGVYFYELKAGNFRGVKKMSLVR